MPLFSGLPQRRRHADGQIARNPFRASHQPSAGKDNTSVALFLPLNCRFKRRIACIRGQQHRHLAAQPHGSLRLPQKVCECASGRKFISADVAGWLGTANRLPMAGS